MQKLLVALRSLGVIPPSDENQGTYPELEAFLLCLKLHRAELCCVCLLVVVVLRRSLNVRESWCFESHRTYTCGKYERCCRLRKADKSDGLSNVHPVSIFYSSPFEHFSYRKRVHSQLISKTCPSYLQLRQLMPTFQNCSKVR